MFVLSEEELVVFNLRFPFAQTSYEGQPDIQLMRFADYFARAFSLVNIAQFPWTKMIKEMPVAKLVDVSDRPTFHMSFFCFF